jgi:uncharacterized membrane protein YhaH (DUF805 family)
LFGGQKGLLMRYRCGTCRAEQWRGLFPEPMFHWRYALIHGVALGVCGSATKLLFARFGYTTDEWRNGLASLGVCAVLLFGFYGVAVVAEAISVATRRCRVCGERGLHLA